MYLYIFVSYSNKLNSKIRSRAMMDVSVCLYIFVSYSNKLNSKINFQLLHENVNLINESLKSKCFDIISVLR